MVYRIKNKGAFLKKISKATRKNSKAIITKANESDIKALCECALNVCHNKVNLNKRAVKKLKKHKTELLRLAFLNDPLKLKKKVLLQTGGALPLLAQIGLTALGSLIPSLFKK
jgi:hypothetical protein